MSYLLLINHENSKFTRRLFKYTKKLIVCTINEGYENEIISKYNINSYNFSKISFRTINFNNLFYFKFNKLNCLKLVGCNGDISPLISFLLLNNKLQKLVIKKTILKIDNYQIKQFINSLCNLKNLDYLEIDYSKITPIILLLMENINCQFNINMNKSDVMLLVLLYENIQYIPYIEIIMSFI